MTLRNVSVALLPTLRRLTGAHRTLTYLLEEQFDQHYVAAVAVCDLLLTRQ
jgi:hypothetical protein